MGPFMSKEQISQFEEYRKRQEWARNIAAELGVEVDKDAQHFVIPIFDKDGKEIRKEYLRAWEEIPLKPSINKREEIKKNIPIRTAIEAIKKHPEMNLRDAVKKLEEEKEGN